MNSVFTHFTATEYTQGLFGGATATNRGTVDPSSGDWTGGVLQNNECEKIFAVGHTTGALGDMVSDTATVTGATLEDASTNVDTDSSNDSASSTPYPIALQPDLTLDSRLLTSGAITNGTDVSYEVDVNNIGDGQLLADSSDYGQLEVSFLMPAGANYVSLDDLDTTDNLDNVFCQPLGDIQTLLPGSPYSGDVVLCAFLPHTGNLLPAHSSYPFKLNMHMTASFVSGTTEVRGLVLGDDADTATAFSYIIYRRRFSWITN